MENVQNNKKLFYTIGEVAQMFNVKVSLIRYWENEFDILKPQRNKKGNRLFTQADLDNLRMIFILVRERGLTIAGVKKKLHDNRQDTINNIEVVQRLEAVRGQLVDIVNILKSKPNE